MKKQVMTITFDNITMEQAVGTAMGHIAARSRCRVVTPNAEFALEAKKNPRFLKILNSSQLVLADGISVILASKILGDPMQGRVTGVGFAQALAEAMAKEGKRLYLLGAKPGVAEQAAAGLCKCRSQRLGKAHTGDTALHGVADDFGCHHHTDTVCQHQLGGVQNVEKPGILFGFQRKLRVGRYHPAARAVGNMLHRRGNGLFHGRFEYACMQSMEQVTKVLVGLALKYGED